MTYNSSKIPFYMLVLIDSLHLMKMHTVNLCVKDENLHKPIKDLMDESTDYTKKMTEHTLSMIEGFFTMLYSPFKNTK